MSDYALQAEEEMWAAIASQPAPASELAWRDGSKGRECVSNAARRRPVCERCGRELGTGLPSPCSVCAPVVPSFVLEVDGFEVRPTWPAPWFVLVRDDVDEPSAPLLVHCETLEDARRHASLGGVVLTSSGVRHVPGCFCPDDCRCRRETNAPCGCKRH